MEPEPVPVFPDAPRSFDDVTRSGMPLYRKDLIYAYRNFRQQFYAPKSVLYPSCYLDASPVSGFPESEIVLLDRDKNAVDVLLKHNLPAICSDIKDYRPGHKHDLVILLNSCFPAELAVPQVADNGYILANDWCGNVKELLARQDYSVTGFISHAGGITAAKRGDWLLDPKFPVLFVVFRKAEKI
ncbi:hypothetical protein HY642_00290 [Candidatus Woesearchaeota archaeon]|nr:hypothetical protein [Candidatus Woesearchaeota archaeon]